MNLVNLGRIIAGRWLIVLLPMIFSLLGGAFVSVTFPTRYEASSRVMLNIIRADPITGFKVSAKGFDDYINAEMGLIHDEQVTGRVVDAMGWLENPDMLAAWQAAPDKGDDFRKWAAKRLVYGVGTAMVPETNIMEIKYQSTSPELARVIADDLRTAYIDATVGQQRDSARGSAANYAKQADRERERLIQLQIIKGNLERTTGIVVSDLQRDQDSRQLQGLVRSPQVGGLPRSRRGRIVGPNVAERGKVEKAQLSQLDLAITAAAQTMGPNNPTLLAMRQRRAVLADHVAAINGSTTVSDLATRNAQMTAGLINQQVEKILSQGDKALALRLVTDEIQRRRNLYDKVSKRAGEQRELANLSDAGLTPIGVTSVNPTPVFPNNALILGGSGGLGLGCGLLLAFLLESFDRRVRAETDLRSAAPAPSLGAIPRFSLPKAPRVRAKREPRPRRSPTPKPPRSAKPKPKPEPKPKRKLVRA